MKKQVLQEKLEALRRCVERIESKNPFTLDQLENNFDLQDIVAINLERAVQICVDIASHLVSESGDRAPRTMAESFGYLQRSKILSGKTALKMRKAVGVRNILVHEYQKVNWEIIHSVTQNHLSDFKLFAKEVARYFNQS